MVAYISGTFGVLIGADLLNLRNLTALRTPVVSIGGAGTFDGIFLTGIIAVLIQQAGIPIAALWLLAIWLWGRRQNGPAGGTGERVAREP